MDAATKGTTMAQDEGIAKFAAAGFDARRAEDGGYVVANAPGGESWIAEDAVEDMIPIMVYERDEE